MQQLNPPNAPWIDLNPPAEAGGYLSIYYSDDLSRLPVRAVTKPGDNKSDPNLETSSYGLFSTCSKSMRSGIVNRRSRYIFFATARNKTRVLAGYYALRWFAELVPAGEGPDYCVAAEEIRFTGKPIALSRVDQLCQTDLSKWFRSMRLLSPEICNCLRDIIDEQPDATAEYLAEIDRLERFNLKHGNYRYISWKQKEKFSWDIADRYLGGTPVETRAVTKVTNSSPSDCWICVHCEQITINKALLRRCPNCGQLGMLQPLTKAEVMDS